MSTQLSEMHQRMIDDFEWPSDTPQGLDDALDLVARFPFPQGYCVAHAGAKPDTLDALERQLGFDLPNDYRRFLLLHDGVQNTWSKSGWMIRSCASLATDPVWAKEVLDFDELRNFGYSRSEWWELLSRDPIDEFDNEGWLDPTGMLLIGSNSSGDLFFVDTVVHGASGHPIARFFHDVQGLRYVHASFGSYLAWLVCLSHTHPQEWDERLTSLFPWPSLGAFTEGAESLRQRALAHLVAVGAVHGT